MNSYPERVSFIRMQRIHHTHYRNHKDQKDERLRPRFLDEILLRWHAFLCKRCERVEAGVVMSFPGLGADDRRGSWG